MASNTTPVYLNDRLRISTPSGGNSVLEMLADNGWLTILEIQGSGVTIEGTLGVFNSVLLSNNVEAPEYRDGNSVKILGAQSAPIADAAGGAIIDVQARAVINELLAKLRVHGLLDT